ncbi:YidH family protein [Peribacillus sp. NPDC097895]|uniref:YidH family protein n=1 Tax=Peribacillus sp. NPDC097895 TaxID=3390619 RepID=UPI003CFC9820
MEKNQLKYAQQHLANERTFLAWIRTVIAIVGIGFLTTSLHFTIGLHRDARIDLISIILGIVACGLGLVITVLATFSYLQKKRQINEENFQPSGGQVVLISVFMVILLSMIILYFLFYKSVTLCPT